MLTDVKTINAREAKNSFGKLLDDARRETVAIERYGRTVAVLMPVEEYERLEDMENTYWLERAETADANGYVGTNESEEFLKKLASGK